MLLRHVRYLMAVADHGSFTRAASALHVSQPALSQQIRQLEERLGATLLDRSGKSIRPTDAGAAFLARARQALAELEAGRRAIADVADLSSGSVRVGLTPSFSAYLIGPLVRRVHERFPGIDLALLELSQEKMEKGLIADALDLGIAFDEVRSPQIDAELMHIEQLALIASRDHVRLGSSESIESFDLERERLALLGSGFVTRIAIDSYFRKCAIRPRPAVEANSVGSILAIIREGSLATILPDVVALGQPDLQSIKLVPAVATRQVALLRRSGAYRSAASSAFARCLRDYAEELKQRVER